MGLDITAYSKLRAVGRHVKNPALNEGEPGGMDDWCYYEDHVQAFAYDCFPKSFAGIPVLSAEVIGTLSFRRGGCYAITDETRTHSFRAGSYSGYNHWRADLARQFNPQPQVPGERYPGEPDPDGPFYELIWFADNEGCIGELAAAELLADFRAHADRYDPKDDIDGWYRSKYDDWTRAFELAAAGGLVRFH
jgi:hypothetical protein